MGPQRCSTKLCPELSPHQAAPPLQRPPNKLAIRVGGKAWFFRSIFQSVANRFSKPVFSLVLKTCFFVLRELLFPTHFPSTLSKTTNYVWFSIMANRIIHFPVSCKPVFLVLKTSLGRENHFQSVANQMLGFPNRFCDRKNKP